MTTAIVTVDPATPVPELARLMLENRIHRLIVVNDQTCPIGVVSVDDLMQVLAHSELIDATSAS
jgi:CBS domain-containing protein